MKNKTLIILLSVLALIISYTANSQFIYASGQYSYTQQYSNVGIHVGLQFKDKKDDNKKGFLIEFTAATHPGSFFAKEHITKQPQLLFLQSGYTVAINKWQLYVLGGIGLHSIGYWTKQNEVLNKIRLPFVGSFKTSYGCLFIQGNYLKHDSGAEFGVIYKFKKD